MRFKKGQLTQESFKVIMHDLNNLVLDNRFSKDNIYHFNLLRDNLKDIWGIK